MTACISIVKFDLKHTELNDTLTQILALDLKDNAVSLSFCTKTKCFTKADKREEILCSLLLIAKLQETVELYLLIVFFYNSF